MPAVAREVDGFDGAVGDVDAPGRLAAYAPDVLAVWVPPFMGDSGWLGHERAWFFTASDQPEAVGDGEFQAGDRVGMAFFGEQDQVGVSGADLGMVVVFNGKLLRQPDDPGVDLTDEPLHRRERSLSCRLIAALVVIEVAAIAAFIWLFGWL